MFFYTNVSTDGNKILFRGYKDQKKITQKVDYSPSLFIESESGEYLSIHKNNLERKIFPTMKEMRDFKSEMSDIENVKLYGTSKVHTQFINEYFEQIEFDFSLIGIKSLDIETTTDHGRIDTLNAPEEITLITLKDFNTKEIVTFGCWDFVFDAERIQSILKKQNIELNLNRLKNFKYVKCTDEKHLLQEFINYWSSDYPDIVTGWNVDLFDITYLSRRILKVLSEKHLKKCSPWGKITEENRQVTADRSEMIVVWEGISSLDYLRVYEKFSYKKLENLRLDTVAKEEIKRKKLEHEYSSFKEFYTKDPYAFTLYNIIDVDLIDEFEEKLKLIQMIVEMAYEARCNYNDVFGTIATWESILYNYLMKKKIIIDLKDGHDSSLSYTIAGGYVKEISPCSHDWNVAFDATSLYPSIIMAFNMSPETLIEGSNLNSPNSDTIDSLVKREIDLTKLKFSKNSYAANGQEFSTKEKGLFPEIVEYFFNIRQKAKKEMLEIESWNSNEKHFKDKVSSLNVKQMAYKILLNGFYGAIANRFFVYFDPRIAEGITLSGQLIIRNAEVNVNKFLSDLFKKEYDYCYYCDTDSLHITLNQLVKKYYSDLDKREVSHILSKVCEDVLTPQIGKICSDLGDYLNLYSKEKISFKREFIASRGIYTAKKRYCLYVYNSEGVEYDPPKPKIMGLEIVRTNIPRICRDKLKEAVVICLSKENKDLMEFVSDFKEKWKDLSYAEIASPTGVNNLFKYKAESGFMKGTPCHVKATYTYNNLLKKHNLSNYEYIKDGDKIRYIYLLKPNPFGNDAIAFFENIPKEFNVQKYVDYDKMLSKSFLAPLDKIASAMGWDIEEKATLEDLFG